MAENGQEVNTDRQYAHLAANIRRHIKGAQVLTLCGLTLHAEPPERVWDALCIKCFQKYVQFQGRMWVM